MSEQDRAERKNTERIFARGFAVLGGIFWVATAFAGPYVYRGTDAVHALLGQAIYPLVFTIAVLAIGWFYERIAAFILALAAAATVMWGVVLGVQGAGWEPFVWGIVLVFFVAPVVVSAVLFYLAGNAPAEGGSQPGHAKLTS